MKIMKVTLLVFGKEDVENLLGNGEHFHTQIIEIEEAEIGMTSTP